MSVSSLIQIDLELISGSLLNGQYICMKNNALVQQETAWGKLSAKQLIDSMNSVVNQIFKPLENSRVELESLEFVLRSVKINLEIIDRKIQRKQQSQISQIFRFVISNMLRFYRWVARRDVSDLSDFENLRKNIRDVLILIQDQQKNITDELTYVDIIDGMGLTEQRTPAWVIEHPLPNKNLVEAPDNVRERVPPTNKVLAKAIYSAVKSVLNNPGCSAARSSVEGYTFVASKIDGHPNISVHLISKKLGVGAFGVVSAALEIRSKATAVYKFAHSDKPEKFKAVLDSFLNEQTLLKMFVTPLKKRRWGIQECHHSVVMIQDVVDDLVGPNASAIPGILTVRYRSDLSKLIPHRKKAIENKVDLNIHFVNIIKECHQLLTGLKTLAELGIVHHDIKLANILGDGGNVVIGDWGTAKLWGDESIFNQNYTPSYQWKKDVFEKQRLFVACFQKKDLTQKEQADLKIIASACDVFSMGCVFFKICMPTTLLVHYDPEGYPSFTFQDSKDSSVFPFNLPGLDQLIYGMLFWNYLERPTAVQALDYYELILKRKYSWLFDQIKEAERNHELR
jgi:serine/threonine protein kinase